MAFGKSKKDKRRKKRDRDVKPHIAAALVPTASFSVVPRTPPPPSPDPQFTSGLASGLLSSTMLGRLFGTPMPAEEENNDEVDTSLEDYAEAGYASVRRMSPGDRDRLDTPTHTRSMEEGLSDEEAGPFYHMLEQEDEVQDEDIPAVLYATPPGASEIYAAPRRKGKGHTNDMEPSIKRPIARHPNQDEGIVEEPMMESHVIRHEESAGVTLPDFDYLDNEPPMRESELAMRESELPMRESDVQGVASGIEDDYRQVDTPRMAALKEQNKSLMNRQEMIEQELYEQKRQQEILMKKLDDTERHFGESQSPLNISNDRELLMDQQMSITDNTLKSQEELIRTLHDRIQTLEHERQEHKDVNTKLQSEIEAFRKHVHGKDGADITETVMMKRQMQDLKDECDTLKTTTHRLNIELSRLQAKYRPTDRENKDIVGLPSKGPIPSWLLNTKYLAPLFLAYDDRIREKDDLLKQYEIEIESFRQRVEEVMKENRRLHVRLEQTDVSGPISMTEWQQLQEQAKLVLEENQLLMEQLEVQQNKSKDMHSAHIREISRLSKQIAQIQSEKSDVENEVTEWKQRYTGLKNKHQVMVLDNEEKLSLPEHTSAINEIKKGVEEMKEAHGKEVNDIMAKLHASQLEKKKLVVQLTDLVAENKQLEIEIKGLQRSNKKSQKKVLILQKALEVSENKEMSAQEYLAHLVKVAEKTAVERDTYAQLVKSQEQERKKALNKMVQGNSAVGKMEEKLKFYKNKAAEKMLEIANKMKNQDEEFTQQRMEYLTEIKHLRGLLKEKEGILENVVGEKKQVEDDLEIMWQAASADNRRMQDTMDRTLRKLREHKALEFMFGEDSESVNLIGYSSDTDR